jgi:hypothetical protein
LIFDEVLIHAMAKSFTVISPQAASRVACGLLFAASFVIAVPRLHAQFPDDPATTAPQPIILQHADSLIGTNSASGIVRDLIGNVVLIQGNVSVSCDRATHYISQNRADLIGNVVITQGSVTMKAPRGIYDGNARLMYGTQGVFLQDRATVLTAREGFYSTATKIARFHRNVRIETDSLIIFADSLDYHRATQNTYAVSNVAAAGKFTTAYLQGDSLTNIPELHYTRVAGLRSQGVGDTLRAVLRQPMMSQIDSVEISEDEAREAEALKKTKGKMKEKVAGKVISKRGNKRATKRGDKQNPQQQKPPQASPSLALQAVKADSLSAIPIANPTAISTTIPTTKTHFFRLDTLCITGDVLEAFRSDTSEAVKRETYVATGGVKLTRGSAKNSLAALSGRGVYEKTLDKIWMFDAPILWMDSTQLRGDSVIINIREKRVERIAADGNGFAATKSDTSRPERTDQLTGENVIISMQRDTLRSIMAEGKAFNLYFLTGEETTTNSTTGSSTSGKQKTAEGAARNAADTIKILFVGGEPDEIL